MTLALFTFDDALDLFDSGEHFPIDFNDAVVWLGYDRGNVTKESFLNLDFVENQDFIVEYDLHPLLAIISPNIPRHRLIEIALNSDSKNQNVKLSEKNYSDALSNLLNGKREVKCDLGFIDVLTENLIIEVKNINHWKGAIRQVNGYANCYPEKEKVIFLLDVDGFANYHLVYTTAKKYNITVWLLSEMFDQIAPFIKMSSVSQNNLVVAKNIRLTVDCFKKLCIITEKSQGIEIRNYFLECERLAKLFGWNLKNSRVLTMRELAVFFMHFEASGLFNHPVETARYIESFRTTYCKYLDSVL